MITKPLDANFALKNLSNQIHISHTIVIVE